MPGGDSDIFLSVVIAVHNEEACLGELVARLDAALAKIEGRAEILFINDASADRTAEILDRIASEDERVQVLHLARNVGHQAALLHGLERARGAAIVTLDADLQHPPELIADMLAERARGFEIVDMRRRDAPGPAAARDVLAGLFYRLFNALSDVAVSPGSTDFRLLDRACIAPLLASPSPARFLRAAVLRLEFRRTELTFDSPARFAGRSTYTIAGLFRLGVVAVAASAGIALRAWARRRPLQAVEAVIALVLAAGLFALGPLRAVWVAVIKALVWGTLSAVKLLPRDPAGVIITGMATLLKAALVTAPALRALRHAPRHRRAWLPLYALFWGFCLPMLFPAIATPLMWALLVLSGVGGYLLAKRPWLRLAALLPLILAYEPTLSHSPLGDFFWTPSRLAQRCEANDGARPGGYDPSKAKTRYFGVTVASDRYLLLTGERYSTWLTRNPDGTADFEKRSRVSGNLWEGCLYGGDVWLTKVGRLFRVTRAADPAAAEHERIEELLLPDPPGTGIELDFADAICDPDHGAVYASELLRGGLRRVSLTTGEVTRAQIGGLNLQLVRRRDGMLVGIDTDRLFVFDPQSRRVIEERAAGIATLGIDLCAADGAVAVTDLAGRLRLFSWRTDHYEYDRGLMLASPRRVAFSEDCQVLGVTSGDDRTVYVVKRDPLSVVKAYSVGPGLRDLTFSGPRTIAAADACSATFLRAE